MGLECPHEDHPVLHHRQPGRHRPWLDRLHQPRHRNRARHGLRSRSQRRRARDRGGPRGLPGMVGDPGRGAHGAARPLAEDHGGRGRRARRAGVSGDGQADRRGHAGRRDAGLRHARVLAAHRGRAPRLPAGNTGAAAGVALAGRLPLRSARGAVDHHAVELPGRHPDVGARTGARGRQYGRHEAGLGLGGHRSDARRPGSPSRLSAGRLQRGGAARLGDRRAARPSRRGQGPVHRLGRGRPSCGAALRRAPGPGSARARWQGRRRGGRGRAARAHGARPGLGGVHEHRAVVRLGRARLRRRRGLRPVGGADRGADRDPERR